MVDSSAVDSTQRPHTSGSTSLRAANATAWSFVYVFFTNGIPFDSPNRSEPCPLP
jgi:hypothetical protein